MAFRLTRGERWFGALNYAFLTLLAFSMCYPLWSVIIYSLSTGYDANIGGIYWWPRKVSLESYRIVLQDAKILSAYGITVARTLVGTATSILFTGMVAFALSRKELPGGKWMISLIFVTMLFNGGLIPFYLLLQGLHLLNTFWVFVIPGLFGTWNMIVMKTSFNDIPSEMIDSAMLDGASYPTIFLRLVLPVSTPMLAALSLFLGVAHWNDWFAGMFFVTKENLAPLQTYLMRILNTTGALGQMTTFAGRPMDVNNALVVSPTTVRMATVVAGVLPIICVYPFMQRFFIKGIMIGSIKG